MTNYINISIQISLNLYMIKYYSNKKYEKVLLNTKQITDKNGRDKRNDSGKHRSKSFFA